MDNRGQLIASGRDCDIFDAGPGLVRRRSRSGRSQAAEARLMEYVRAHGFPAPAVDHLSGDETEILMEHVEGPTMFEALEHRPWTLHAEARTLAELHHRLHEIAAPDWLRPLADGNVVMHLDLHPLNVLCTARGPVLIDWSNAARGTAGFDIATTWLLLATSEIPGGRVKRTALGAFRNALTSAFLRHAGRETARSALPAAAAVRHADPHVTPAERRAIARLVERTERRSAGVRRERR